ncbi:MAG: NRAMP family divalent metal transporter [Acidobacteriota bacterium]
MNRLLLVLFWSVISAAFIGPGTVTACASAGAGFGLALLWALAFSTLACLVLQEAAARVTVVSGLDLGRAIRRRFPGGRAGLPVLLLVLGAVLLGCAAYEAGNILGGVSGAHLGTGLPRAELTLACGASAGILLWFGRARSVARLMGCAVALMGAAFLAVAALLRPPPLDLLRGGLVPSFPSGSGMLVLGLIGTTVVPYNLFLGSGLAGGQTLRESRFGLAVAIPLGGIISMAILVAGTAVSGRFDFDSLSTTLAGRLGAWAGPLFAFGLFGAGLSSAVTAPLAAAVTARGLFGGRCPERWEDRSWRYRTVWMAILLVGLAFGLLEVRPVPAILLAQALNGLLLPFVALFLLIVLNDRRIVGRAGLNGPAANLALGGVVAVTLVLGAYHTLGPAAVAVGLPAPGGGALLAVSGLAAGLAFAPVLRSIRRRRDLI